VTQFRARKGKRVVVTGGVGGWSKLQGGAERGRGGGWGVVGGEGCEGRTEGVWAGWALSLAYGHDTLLTWP